MHEETKSLAATDDGVPMSASSLARESRAHAVLTQPASPHVSGSHAGAGHAGTGHAGGAATHEGTSAELERNSTNERDFDEEDEPRTKKKTKLPGNNVRKMRLERMISKAELARRANLSVLTVDRVEKGYGCRMDTKRKILEALGLSLADRVRVFGEEE